MRTKRAYVAAMKTEEAVTLLDRYALVALPTMLQINNGDIRDSIKDSYEVALEAIKQRRGFHQRALAELELNSGEMEATEFNRLVDNLPAKGEIA
jgi:hypothetical protein